VNPRVRGLFCPSPPEGKEGGSAPFLLRGLEGGSNKGLPEEKKKGKAL